MDKSIEIQCPNGHRLKGSPKLQGKKIRCPKCQAVVSVPVEQPSEAVDAFEIVPAIDTTTVAAPAANTSRPASSPDLAHDPFGLSDLPAMDAPVAAPRNSSVSYQPPTRNVPVAPKEPSWLSQNMPLVAVGASIALVLLVLVVGLGAYMAFSPSTTDREIAGDTSAEGEPTSNLAATTTKGTEAAAGSLSNNAKTKSSAALASTPSASTWPDYAPAHPEGLIECPLLQEELGQHMNRVSSFPDEPDELLPRIRSIVFDVRENGYSTYLLVTPEENELLKSGKPYEPTTRRVQLLEAGLAMMNLPATTVRMNGLSSQRLQKRADFAPTPIGERVYADHLAVIWRQVLPSFAFSKQLNKENIAIIREVEDKCFGEDSIFQPYQNRWTERLQERLRLTQVFPRIAQAFKDFEAKHGQMPNDSGAPAITGGGLSWRVALLPFLGHQELYDQFHLDEAWNSPHNQELIKKMPEVFATRSVRFSGADAKTKDLLERFDRIPPEQVAGLTTYHLVVEPQTFFGGNNRRYSEIVEADKKMLFTVCNKTHLVPWTQPGGVTIEQVEQHSGFSYMLDGTIFCTFDGQARFVSYAPSSLGKHMYTAKRKVEANEYRAYCHELHHVVASNKLPEFYEYRYKLRSRIISIERKK